MLSEEEKAMRKGCKGEISKVMDLEEVSWRQKSCALWLQEGDENTKFLHRLANSHHRNNFIGSLSIEENTITDPKGVQEGIVQFYQHLYFESSHWQPKLDGLSFNRLASEEVYGLIRPLEDAKVLVEVCSMARDKAPGPDGFHNGNLSSMLECGAC